MVVERRRLHYEFDLKIPANQWKRRPEQKDEAQLEYYSIEFDTTALPCPCRECGHTLQRDCHILDLAGNHPAL